MARRNAATETRQRPMAHLHLAFTSVFVSGIGVGVSIGTIISVLVNR
ncbi:hypothetical protein [Microbacterium album]|nr:hypothetical protein [Microbacterium album]